MSARTSRRGGKASIPELLLWDVILAVLVGGLWFMGSGLDTSGVAVAAPPTVKPPPTAKPPPRDPIVDPVVDAPGTRDPDLTGDGKANIL